eukprot:364775-Chlamydomonas_euryale.AAC.13
MLLLLLLLLLPFSLIGACSAAPSPSDSRSFHTPRGSHASHTNLHCAGELVQVVLHVCRTREQDSGRLYKLKAHVGKARQQAGNLVAVEVGEGRHDLDQRQLLLVRHVAACQLAMQRLELLALHDLGERNQRAGSRSQWEGP